MQNATPALRRMNSGYIMARKWKSNAASMPAQGMIGTTKRRLHPSHVHMDE
jgi:hypothetical protein